MHSFPILMIFIPPERNNKSMVNQIVDPTISYIRNMENIRKVNPRMVVYSGPAFLEQILTCFSELRMTYDLMYL